MGSSTYSILVALLICDIVAVCVPSSASSNYFDFDGAAFVPMTSECRGSIAVCMEAGEEEFAMDSETNRRILAARRYISYGALQRNTVPCSRRGASYYNCQRGAQANPYSRGCSRITRCRS